MGRLDLLTVTLILIIGIFTSSSIALTEASDISLNLNSIEFNKNLIALTNNTVNNTQPLLCNGNADLCDLRYDQVTHPGTHNSAAYNLRFDCQQQVYKCRDSAEECSRQYAQCLGNHQLQCDAQASQCKQFNPNWAHFLCNGFDNACKTSNAICYAWNLVCKEAGNVCNVWSDACNLNLPNWVLECLWENNPGHDLAKQLQDGIRSFDLDTCLVNDDGNQRVVLCHGMGPSRALGDELDNAFKTFRNFINENPNEIITLEFGDTDGDPRTIGNYIQKKLAEYFIDSTTGHVLMHRMDPSNTTWPTLREMVQNNQRIVVFFGYIYIVTDNIQNWIQTSDSFTGSYKYTMNSMTSTQLQDSFIGWCQNSTQIIQEDIKELGRPRWQTIDAVVSLVLPQLKQDLENLERPNAVCLDSLARSVNFDVLDNITNFCVTKFPYFYRVKVDDYWQSNLFEVVNRLNQMNLKRYLNR